jgi:hypothetical protein
MTLFENLSAQSCRGGESWSNAQLASKMKRLSMIRSPANPKTYFVIASPNEPQKVISGEWPAWVFKDGVAGEPYWIPLHLPESTKQWLRVALCDNGEYWRLCEASR